MTSKPGCLVMLTALLPSAATATGSGGPCGGCGGLSGLSWGGWTEGSSTSARASAHPFAPAVAARLLGRAGLGSGHELRPMVEPVNRLLRGVVELEGHWLARCDIPIGLSLLCLAEKS